MDLSHLNKEQKHAVMEIKGPVMCIAGAGTGKTRVLTNRIAYLLSQGVPKGNIAAVTFTNKAATEMKERVASLVDIDVSDMWISTFHSFGLRILREEIVQWQGYKKGFTVIDEEDSNKVMKKIIESFDIPKTDCITSKIFLTFVSMEKNKQYNQLVFDNDYQEEWYRKARKLYDAELIAANAMDFDDLILNTIKLLNDSEYVLKTYIEKFQYILIDEFQDTNLLQYELMTILCQKHKNIFIVGDQDQSIYSFRGARIGNIDQFMKDYPDYKLIKIEENYRSTPEILNLANDVISKNTNRIDKNLFTSKESKQKPLLTVCNTDNSEVEFIFKEILRLTGKGYNYSDIAIMYRSNYLSRNFESTFKRYKVPYTIYGGISYFARKEVKDILAYLKLAINFDDKFSFDRIINVPARKISKESTDKIFVESVRYDVSMFKAIDYIESNNVSKQCYESLRNFKNIIYGIKEFISNEKNDIKNVIDVILETTGYLKMLSSKKEENDQKLLNILELKNVIREAMYTYSGTVIEKLTQMLEDTVLKTDLDNLDDNDNKVKLMTYHQAKGLEFPIVFMMATEDGVFPNGFATNRFELEEERRICYVGITRAKERLFITCAKKRFMYGRVAFNKPSQFISNVSESLLERQVQM